MGVIYGNNTININSTDTGRNIISTKMAVQSGLVLNLDAGVSSSYPGSGTTWTDLSGNGNTGTLNNSPTYSSTNGGSIVFDGLDDYVEGSQSFALTSTITVSAWIKHNTLPSSIQRYLTVSSETAVIRHDGSQSVGLLHFYITTNSTIQSITVNNSLTTNTWYNVVGTWDGTTQKLYKNGVLIGSNTPGGTMSSGNYTYLISSSAEPLNGNISQTSVYNRALSATEIQQNFNAFRGRFGI